MPNIKSSNKKRKGNRRRSVRPRSNPNNPSLGQGGKPTLVIKTHQMLNASIDTSTSFVKQINITPFLGSLPTALEQSKFYQQYRISKVQYTVLPLQSTNTTNAVGNQATPFLYSVALRNTSIPGANQGAYLTYKNVMTRRLDRVIKASFVPYVQSTQQSSTQVMLRSPLISTKQTNPLHFGHSLLMCQTNANTFSSIRVLVECTVQFYVFDGQKASMIELDPQEMRERYLAQVSEDLELQTGQKHQVFKQDMDSEYQNLDLCVKQKVSVKNAVLGSVRGEQVRPVLNGRALNGAIKRRFE